MFSSKVTRKKYIKNYPATFNRVQREFLETAIKVVEGEAKLQSPYQTGTLRNSITGRVEGEQGIVGTNVEYAPYMEYGTKFTKAQPFLRPALDNNKKNLLNLFSKIFKRYFSGR